MPDAFADAFQEMAEEGRRRPIDEVIGDLTMRVGECLSDHGTPPDVLILLRCADGLWWTHNGLTHERAVYMAALAQHGFIVEDPGDEE